MTLRSMILISMGMIVLPAAFAKLRTPDEFAKVMTEFPFNRFLQSVLARVFPILEGLAAAVLLLVHDSAASALVGVTLFLLFALTGTYLLRSTKEGLPLCGCLGGLGHLRVTRGSIVLNVTVMAAGVAAIWPDSVLIALPIPGGLTLAITLASAYWLTSYALSVLEIVKSPIVRSVGSA